MALRRSYGQFCPVAKAAEIIAERWTPLVVRELLNGSRHFGQLQRGIPLVSPSMLSQRLRELQDAGVVQQRQRRGRRSSGGGAREYRLTSAGEALAPVLEQLGVWGQRWAATDLRREDLDPDYLIWAMHRRLGTAALGPARVVIAFDLVDAPANRRHWWLVARAGEVEICLKHPGHPVDVTVAGRLHALASVWLGKLTPDAAVRSGKLHLHGTASLVRRFDEWCPRTSFAPARAPRPPAR
jgi:DNA-binding HxlR family transcriptional regulator